MIETTYKVGDVIYVVNDFRVVKSIVDSIVIKEDQKGTTVSYNIYEYSKKNDAKKKIRTCLECYIVKDLEIAKQSALANWRTITAQVEKDLNNLTDEMFEPKQITTIVHGAEGDSK